MLTYKNPVYSKYFADPYVWKHDGKYYAVGTGPLGTNDHTVQDEDLSSSDFQGEERAIPVLTSDNFVDWKFAGGALRVPPDLKHKPFWAPEVAFHKDHFYLYYSTAMEGLRHMLRVAKSRFPDGPYEDLGRLIGDTHDCPFAIDGHAFLDDDGQWYLFYARDFLNQEGGANAGTALVVDRLNGMTKLAGEEKVVLRSKCNWQLFKAQREMYGKIWDWHTMEGPCVRKRNGLYYCFYSGGCYENDTYGVDYGVAENVMGPYSDEGNESGPRVLKTVPGRVPGPGHISIVNGPDDQTEYMVYHAWDIEMKSRLMCMDKLEWTDNGPRCAGPTWTEQNISVPEMAGLRD
ncbi:MAG: family 43 glycosylhydrolase [Verrucomicrobia bacterium]|nr:family 43 glycosylhydrolase [Verrucomicrobiota bacterium]